MEKRIVASWCLARVERANRNRCSGLHDFPAPKIQAKAGNAKPPPGFPRGVWNSSLRAKLVIPGCALLGAAPESSTMHCSGFRVRAKTRAPE
jgi:hypothetical protein